MYALLHSILFHTSLYSFTKVCTRGFVTDVVVVVVVVACVDALGGRSRLQKCVVLEAYRLAGRRG